MYYISMMAKEYSQVYFRIENELLNFALILMSCSTLQIKKATKRQPFLFISSSG